MLEERLSAEMEAALSAPKEVLSSLTQEEEVAVLAAAEAFCQAASWQQEQQQRLKETGKRGYLGFQGPTAEHILDEVTEGDLRRWGQLAMLVAALVREG